MMTSMKTDPRQPCFETERSGDVDDCSHTQRSEVDSRIKRFGTFIGKVDGIHSREFAASSYISGYIHPEGIPKRYAMARYLYA